MGSTYPGGRSVIREAYRLRNIPESAVPIFIASIKESTFRQYNSALKRWWSYCSNLNIDPFLATVSDLLCFLTNWFEKGAAYGTLNLARSVINLILKEFLRNPWVMILV